MRVFLWAALLAFTLIFGSPMSGYDDAVAAPAQLYGKSVIVSWTEEREQRAAGESSVRNVVVLNGRFRADIGSTGRVFSRMSYAFSGRGAMKAGRKDPVGGEGHARFRLPTIR